MTIEELAEMLESIPGFENKVAYRAFPEKEAPELPYIVYEEDGTDNVFADNQAYVERSRITISIIEDYRNRATEKLLENALNEHGIAWNRYPRWIEEEKIYQVDYDMEV